MIFRINFRFFFKFQNFTFRAIFDLFQQSGIIYVFGRDQSLRPITICRVKRLYEYLKPGNNPNRKNIVKKAIRRISTYLDQKLFARGKVETTVVIFDLKKVISREIHYLKKLDFGEKSDPFIYTQVHSVHVINASFGILAVNRFIKGYLPAYLQKKSFWRNGVFNRKKDKRRPICFMQLEQIHGGDASNLSELKKKSNFLSFW